ncbi:xanthine dehydrogenase accessory protein XdhC [Echinimonas agarilytica]|uniref:Xanthine dehydrogenase accessory protein XdhC n=1 Tax=Echinimonas agarilytica TaxID=1215918 RepID=A0AA42B8H1_9GAMM|nr:xanthine dehydrogenase accessory protein XdhC [Echinimonas agarilytica]MCM2680216.1 xanthine dehydrogenase accessory protein XdhC [Echinimonas agarilytica]
MNSLNWSDAILHCQHAGQGYVIATIIDAQGSTPRDGGSKMVIDDAHCYDTLGGGQLEFLVTQQARELLAANQSCQIMRPIPLAAEAAQCCGGNVLVMLECFAKVDWQINLFGAGHVAQALVKILAELPCQVNVIDSRAEYLQHFNAANCRVIHHADPTQTIAEYVDNSWNIIFTHDHQLDYKLCSELLRYDRWAFVGLIGSRTKAQRFHQRLKADGFEEQYLTCPIGLPDVRGKRPMEVAVSIAAQLQSLYYQEQPRHKRKSTSWRTIKKLIGSNQLESY